VISVVYGANKNPSTHKQPYLEPKFVYQFDKYFFKVYQNNALKIAPCGSCQINESVNNIIHVHAINRFYGIRFYGIS